MNHFGDPGYRYHTLMSQLWGVTALRLANADLLPFDFATYASNIRQFVNELASKNKSVILSGGKAAVKDLTRASATNGVSGNSHETAWIVQPSQPCGDSRPRLSGRAKLDHHSNPLSS